MISCVNDNFEQSNNNPMNYMVDQTTKNIFQLTIYFKTVKPYTSQSTHSIPQSASHKLLGLISRKRP